MSDLQNPLFDDEREFLERKKLEYERALRGDVDHIKDQSVKAGKVALVGAGLAGGIWLITKAFGGKKKRKRPAKEKGKAQSYDTGHDDSESDHDYEFGTGYFSSGRGRHDDEGENGVKSAAESAQVFNEHHEHMHEADDLGFGSTAATHSLEPQAQSYASNSSDSDYDTEEFEEDPFQDLPYDDSRRLPASHAFDDEPRAAQASRSAASSRSRMVGTVLQAFLQSDTGKMLVAQAAAVAMALVTKKVSEFFPAAKNSDLAASPGSAPVAPEGSPVASSVSPVPSDASNPPQSL